MVWAHSDSAVRRRRVAVDHEGWVQAHSSTVLPVDDGVLCAWFAGTHEGTADNGIWLADRRDGAWSAPRVVASGDEAHWNPVLTRGPRGDVWLFFQRGARISQWRSFVIRSSDGGASWSDPVEIVPGAVGGRGPVKNPPLLLPGGEWLAPGSEESWDEPVTWSAFVDRSVDGGATWDKRPLPMDRSGVRGAGAIQPALWEGREGLYALTRSSGGRALRSRSTDLGLTWSTLEPTALVNNNSALTVVRIDDDVIACVHNPVAGDWAARCPLAVSVSADDGTTWTLAVIVEDGQSALDDAAPALVPRRTAGAGGFAPADSGVLTDGRGEYSYPSAAVDGDALLITYTWQRRGTVEAHVPLDTLRCAASAAPDSPKETRK